MAKRVFLHVGTPKSGTTYLQSVLWQNAAQLKDNGLLLPGQFKMHYAAAKGVTSRSSLKHDIGMDVSRAWPRLAHKINRWDGDAAISHELLAPATVEQASNARSLLGDAEVHIVVTARALHKQLPASWQEQVKAGHATPFGEFLRRVEDRQGKGVWFADVQDVPAIARRWGVGIPPDRIHIVTVPTQSADPSELWRRYATALEIDPDAYDTAVPQLNVSLGAVESELLRQVHAVRDPRFRDTQRHRWTRKLLATEILGQHRGATLSLPDRSRAWVEEQVDASIDQIDGHGYHVIGTLDDLQWQPPSAHAMSIDSITRKELAVVSAWTIARLQEQFVQRQPRMPPPPVGPDDGVAGILELLEHIRAADTSRHPRPGPVHRTSPTDRLRKSITALRGR